MSRTQHRAASRIAFENIQERHNDSSYTEKFTADEIPFFAWDDCTTIERIKKVGLYEKAALSGDGNANEL